MRLTHPDADKPAGRWSSLDTERLNAAIDADNKRRDVPGSIEEALKRAAEERVEASP